MLNWLSALLRKSTDTDYIVSVLLLFVLWSCGTTPDKVSDNPMSVDIDARHEVSIFDIFERVELIPLETTDESIFRHVQRLHYHDGVLYILDWVQIFAFDSTTGEFLFKIDDRGQGPEEYLHINDFGIDRQRNKLLVLDPMTNNLIEYDLNGRHLRRTRLPDGIDSPKSFRCLGNGIIALWAFGGNRLRFYDRNLGSIFSEHFFKEASVLDHFVAGNLTPSNLLMSATAPLTNNIYEIFPDGTYSVAFTWDFGRLNNCETILRHLPERIRLPEERRLLERMYNSEIVNYFFQRIGDNQRYRYAQILRKNQHVHLLHNISEGHTHVFTEFSEDATFYPIFWSDEFVIGLGTFAGYREETIPDAILDDRNLAIKRNICEFDNPILIKYWFRR